MPRVVSGRTAVTRKEMTAADITGAGESTLRALYTDRDNSGHPASAFSIGRAIYWWQDEILAWWAGRQAELAKTKPAPIERIGDPNDLLTADEIAELLGRTQGRSIIAAANRGAFPKPDPADYTSGEGQKGGKARPRWKRSVVWEHADSRTFDRTAKS
jgi:predicted DNA-binding transcriptional regulator AlpA